MELGRRLRGLTPRWTDTDPELNPFPGKAARKGQGMIFNVARYSDRLSRQFRLMGGRMIRRSFTDRSDALSLPQPGIVNCMGYGAIEKKLSALWKPSAAPIPNGRNRRGADHNGRAPPFLGC